VTTHLCDEQNASPHENPSLHPPITLMNAQSNLLSKQQVMVIIHMSDRSIERLVKARRFPAPLCLGKGVFWDEQVVAAWLNAKLEAQRAWKPKQRRGAAANTPGLA
jgi:prophage regulatory protein